jgi:hypothetical protein
LALTNLSDDILCTKNDRSAFYPDIGILFRNNIIMSSWNDLFCYPARCWHGKGFLQNDMFPGSHDSVTTEFVSEKPGKADKLKFVTPLFLGSALSKYVHTDVIQTNHAEDSNKY